MSDVNYQQQQAEFLIWISKEITKEITEANERLPIDVSQMNRRQFLCGVAAAQQLKMDNKLVGPLTVEHVLHCALVFEMYLWGKWSKDIAGRAMEATLGDLEKAIKGGALDKHIDELVDEPPTRPHSGGEG